MSDVKLNTLPSFPAQWHSQLRCCYMYMKLQGCHDFLSFSCNLFEISVFLIEIYRTLLDAIPYRNLNYEAQKFGMVLSSPDTHGINC